ncbi:MAG TPA: biotin/lipoyl-containing protein [Gemmatimonadales bacterium]|nr:biotin/lipoyl-containing protein [Gemmatimonadales bacterium]
MKYFVKLDGTTHEVTVDGENVLVDGRPARAHLEMVHGTPVCHLVLDGRSHTFAVGASPAGGKWTLVDRGEQVEVEVLDERTRHIQSLVGAGKSQSGGGAVKAPMPGLVVKILVEPGATVVAGQGLVVLEAMKMENEIKSTIAAVVESVAVQPGQAVEKGTVLVALRTP